MNYKRLFVSNSLVFITIITHNRNPILIENIDYLKEAVSKVKEIYSFNIYAYCILKDHFHLIIKLENIKDYPKIIKSIKYSFTEKFKNKINNLNLE